MESHQPRLFPRGTEYSSTLLGAGTFLRAALGVARPIVNRHVTRGIQIHFIIYVNILEIRYDYLNERDTIFSSQVIKKGT